MTSCPPKAYISKVNPKLAAAVLGVVVLGIVGYFVSAKVLKKPPETNPSPTEVTFDFGDAPDGGQDQFPSRLASNGARVKKTDGVWLGETVTAEIDSKQMDTDEADDGVKVNATPCKQSTAYFFVRIKNPGEMTGTAYLNLYADWNKDRRWAGNDECAPEWAVQNFSIDIGKQTNEVAVYEAAFTAGKNTDMIWYRGAVTQGQKMDETSTGEFLIGEVEDWGPHIPVVDEKYYNFYCDPDPLIISHGSEGDVGIAADWGSEPIFDVSFGQNYQPKNPRRQVAIKDKAFVYQSANSDVDGPKRSVPHAVSLRVRFGANGKEAVLEKLCTVIVRHDMPTIKIPGGLSSPVPAESPRVKTESGGSTKTEDHPTQEAPGVTKY